MSDVDVDLAEFIHVTHPDVEGIGGPVTRRAFNDLWAGKGWTEVSPAAAAVTRVTGEKVEDLSALSKDVLTDIAASSYGIDTTGMSKAELIAAIESAASPA